MTASSAPTCTSMATSEVSPGRCAVSPPPPGCLAVLKMRRRAEKRLPCLQESPPGSIPRHSPWATPTLAGSKVLGMSQTVSEILQPPRAPQHSILQHTKCGRASPCPCLGFGECPYPSYTGDSQPFLVLLQPLSWWSRSPTGAGQPPQCSSGGLQNHRLCSPVPAGLWSVKSSRRRLSTSVRGCCSCPTSSPLCQTTVVCMAFVSVFLPLPEWVPPKPEPFCPPMGPEPAPYTLGEEQGIVVYHSSPGNRAGAAPLSTSALPRPPPLSLLPPQHSKAPVLSVLGSGGPQGHSPHQQPPWRVLRTPRCSLSPALRVGTSRRLSRCKRDTWGGMGLCVSGPDAEHGPSLRTGVPMSMC